MRRERILLFISILVLTIPVFPLPAGAAHFAAPQMQAVWERTDKPVADGVATRTWIWGPDAFTGALQEDYVEGSLADGTTGKRLVQYQEKSRMEITNPNAPQDKWYVTNGLLSTELISGRQQMGNNTFIQRAPAQVNVAGDPNDPNGPTYASFTEVLNAPSQPVGTVLIQRINRAGAVANDAGLAAQNVSVGSVDTVTNHGVAQPFWAFMNSTGTIYQNGQFVQGQLFDPAIFATGRPVTEAYWQDVLVGGTARLVLIQCFERRCLTYTPSNAPDWRVEMGNIGLHYHTWRYNLAPAINYVFNSRIGSVSLATRDVVSPSDIAFDTLGNMYVLNERPLGRVQKFNPNGVFLREWGSTGTNNGQFRNPNAIEVDMNNNVYVVDTDNARVQKFDENGTWLLNFQGAMADPWGIAADKLGNVYVYNDDPAQIFKYNSNGELQMTFGTPGNGDGQLSSASHLAVSPDNNFVYVADGGNNRIQVFSSTGNYVRQWGSQGNGNSQFSVVQGIAVSPDGNRVYTAELANNRIQVFDTTPDATYITQWGVAGAAPGQLASPFGIALPSNATVYVADQGNARVQSFSTADNSVLSIIRDDSRSRFRTAEGNTHLASGSYVVVDSTLNQVKIFDPAGNYLSQWGSEANAPFIALNGPTGVAVDSQDMIYVTDTGNNRIVKYNAQGVQQAAWGMIGAGNGEFNSPTGIDFDGMNNVYIADSNNNRVQKFSADGVWERSWGMAGTGDGQFNQPGSIAVHENVVYVTDRINNRVQRFDLSGVYQAQFGTAGTGDGQFNIPGGIDTDTQGYIYVVDTNGNRVQKFTPALVYLAAFGSGGANDGQFANPRDLAVLPNGNVAVTDQNNWRVQIFRPQ